MSYNWISVATPQGRERLEELTDNGIVVARMTFAPDEIGQCYWMDGFRLNLCGEVVRTWDEAEHSGYTDDGRSILDCIEFLDPDPMHKSEEQCQLEARIRRLESHVASLESDNANHLMNLDNLDNQIASIKAENDQLVKICQDNAGKEIVDKVLFDRQNAGRQPEPPYPAQGSPEWMQIQRYALRSHPRAPYWKLYENVIRNAAKDLKPRSGITKEMVRQSLEQVLAHSDYHTPEPKPLSIDEMREYCIKWCESHEEPLDSPNWCSAKPQHPGRPLCWYICSTFFSSEDSDDGQIRLVYAIIRAIERGEI